MAKSLFTPAQGIVFDAIKNATAKKPFPVPTGLPDNGLMRVLAQLKERGIIKLTGSGDVKFYEITEKMKTAEIDVRKSSGENDRFINTKKALEYVLGERTNVPPPVNESKAGKAAKAPKAKAEKKPRAASKKAGDAEKKANARAKRIAEDAAKTKGTKAPAPAKPLPLAEAETVAKVSR